LFTRQYNETFWQPVYIATRTMQTAPLSHPFTFNYACYMQIWNYDVTTSMFKKKWRKLRNFKPSNFYFSRSHWPRGLRRRSEATRLLILWVRIPPGAWMSVVCVVCRQLEVLATSWSLVQRSPTDCDASLCVIYRVFNLKMDRILIRFTTCYITQLNCIYSKCWKWCPLISMHLSTRFAMFLPTILSVLSFTSSMARVIFLFNCFTSRGLLR
jgi:hypothetical protein